MLISLFADLDHDKSGLISAKDLITRNSTAADVLGLALGFDTDSLARGLVKMPEGVLCGMSSIACAKKVFDELVAKDTASDAKTPHTITISELETFLDGTDPKADWKPVLLEALRAVVKSSRKGDESKQAFEVEDLSKELTRSAKKFAEQVFSSVVEWTENSEKNQKDKNTRFATRSQLEHWLDDADPKADLPVALIGALRAFAESLPTSRDDLLDFPTLKRVMRTLPRPAGQGGHPPGAESLCVRGCDPRACCARHCYRADIDERLRS